MATVIWTTRWRSADERRAYERTLRISSALRAAFAHAAKIARAIRRSN